MKKTVLFIFLTVAAVVFIGNKTAIPRQEPPGEPEVLLLNSKWLIQAKKRIASGDPSLEPAFARLQKDAESVLDDGPFSVMDKTLTPPSGNKHDYMSFGPYWWPDPKKSNGLPYIRRDGQTNPESKTGGSDSPKLGRMINTVETLTLAYYFTGDEKYAKRAVLLLKTWFLNPDTKMNPHLKYGQAIPGRVEGRGIGIIDTRNLTKVVDAASLLSGSPAWTADDHKRLKAWFKAYLDWLRTSKHGKDEDGTRNNHGTWYDVQLADFALFVGNREFARSVLESVKLRRIATQILSDGKQPHELARTRTFDYSTMNLTAFFSLARLGEHVEVDLWKFETADKRSIRHALDYLAPYADPKCKWPHKQIREYNSLQLLPLLRQGAIVYKAQEYEEMIMRLPADKVRNHRYQLLCPLKENKLRSASHYYSLFF